MALQALLAAAPLAIELYERLFPSAEARAIKEQEGRAARLEQKLTSAALSRLSGNLDPATRAEIQRSLESSRAEQENMNRQISRNATKSGIAGSGLTEVAKMRLNLAGQRERAAGVAQIEAASLANAQQISQGLAIQSRANATYFRQLQQQRKENWGKLMKAGADLYQQMKSTDGGTPGVIPNTSRYEAPTMATPIQSESNVSGSMFGERSLRYTGREGIDYFPPLSPTNIEEPLFGDYSLSYPAREGIQYYKPVRSNWGPTDSLPE